MGEKKKNDHQKSSTDLIKESNHEEQYDLIDIFQKDEHVTSPPRPVYIFHYGRNNEHHPNLN